MPPLSKETVHFSGSPNEVTQKILAQESIGYDSTVIMLSS